MNAEFNWWLLIVGLVIGAGLVWLVVADSRRREADLTELERDGEAQWIASAMIDAGRHVDEGDVLDILRLHAAYLAAVPPDQAFDDDVADEAAMAIRRPRPIDRTRGSGHVPAGGRAEADGRTAADDHRWVAVPESTPGPESSVNRR